MYVYEYRTKFPSCTQSSSKQAFLPKHLSKSLAGGSRSHRSQQCTRNERTGRLDCVFVDLEAMYPRSKHGTQEFCFEELRARHRGYLDKEWPREAKKAPKEQLAQPALDITFSSTDFAQSQSVNAKPTKGFQIHRDEPAGSDSAPSRRGLDPRTEEQDQGNIVQAPAKGFKVHQDGPETALKQKKGGFKIFEDSSSAPKDHSRQNDKVHVETSSRTLALNDENDENAAPSQESQPSQAEILKKMRREERANRTRKIQVMDVKHIKNETKTITINMDSPTKSKPKRKKSVDKPVAEPTMTINTREAMDEIYGIFNQPLPSQNDQTDGEEEDSDDDYTTGDESTGTGKLSGPPSEYGDETRNELLRSQGPTEDQAEDQTDNTGWSDFTKSRHIPGQEAGTESAPDTTQSSSWGVYQDENQQPSGDLDDELVLTPQEDHYSTRTVPIASEDHEPPSDQFQQMSMLPNHRLPFMTPIAEQTESSLGTVTARAQKDYFDTKTPSRPASGAVSLPEEDDEPPSSPFQEVTIDLADEKHKVLQPIRTKSTKGTISLGQGSAKNQIAAKVTVPSAPEPVQKGPIIKEQQCNPMDPYLRDTILSQMKPSLTSYEGYHEHLDTTSGRTAEVKKFIKTLSKVGRSSVNLDKTASTLSLPPMLTFSGTEATYTVKRELGAGTFAPVYLVENSAAIQAAEQGNDENRPPSRSVGKLAHRKPLEAVKMEEPASTWEFYILRQSHRRLGVSRAAESIVRAHEMHIFRDECFLVEEYRSQGTLLDLVNIARADSTASGGMDEVMAMWLSIELLRTVEALHSKGIIHGDLKGDNVLVRFDDPGQETDWSPTYFSSGAHGWASKGICLIDFGRGVDMKQFVPNVGFIADWKTSEADCAEMREMRPWTYQVDYHGLAGIIHSLLFGKYMETVGEKQGAGLGQGSTKTYRIRESLKRYWQTDIWAEAFQLLLNPLAHVEQEEGKRMPVVNGLRSLREKMEGWLEENCERGVGLKGMIGRMEKIIWERRRKSVKA